MDQLLRGYFGLTFKAPGLMVVALGLFFAWDVTHVIALGYAGYFVGLIGGCMVGWALVRYYRAWLRK